MKKFALLDTCYPDYFRGYHRSVIAINLNPQTTNKDIVDGIRLETNYVPTDYSKTEKLIISEYCGSLLEDPEGLFFNDPDYNNENCPEEYEVYAYFSIIKPVYSNGIMFLS